MKVYYSGNFRCSGNREEAGTQVILGRSFEYGGYEWLVPAVYCCDQGLVLDICRKIPVENVKAFYRKWAGADEEEITAEQRDLIEYESPWNLEVSFKLRVNGRKIAGDRSCGGGWQGFGEEAGSDMTGEAMEAYGLDRNSAWYIHRAYYRWDEKGREEIKSLSLLFDPEDEEIPCGCHFATSAGCVPFKVPFYHPITGEEYRLSVFSCVGEVLPDESLEHEMPGIGKVTFPGKYCVLEYEVERDKTLDGKIVVKDVSEDDPAQREEEEALDGPSAIGLIFGSDKGDTRGVYSRERTRSSMHFEKREQTDWYISLKTVRYKPQEFQLF